VTLSPVKRIVFALVAITGSFLVMLLVLLGADLYAHTRVERSAGLNRQGYRGPVIGKKRAGETRVAMLGGSTVFGFDVEVEETVPALLDRELAKSVSNVRVVNLGFHQEGAISFVPTLRSYEYLDYDIVILYEGYNDIFGDAAPTNAQRRHASPVFRLTGYYPILPLVLREKASFLRSGPGGPQATFKPGLAKSTSAAALEATSAITEALNRQLDRLVDPPDTGPHTGPGCASPWSHYCGSVAAAIRFARERQKDVLVIGQPRLSYEGSTERHASQQRALAEMIARDFGNDAHVRYADFGSVISTSDVSIAFDGMHLNAKGNGIIAEHLAPLVREMLPH
jgi:hypothetical protein